jgi:hypothetical protein
VQCGISLVGCLLAIQELHVTDVIQTAGFTIEDLQSRKNQQARPDPQTLLRIERILGNICGGDTIVKR